MRSLVPILVITLGVACTAKDSGTTAQTDTTSAAATTTTTNSSSTEVAITPSETAVAPEVNPPGDIPDSQAFITFTNSTGGYQLEVPEGWARTPGPPEYSSDINFIDKYDGVSVHIIPATAAPTVASARANEVKQMESHYRAVKIIGVVDGSLPSGKVIAIKYTSNSDASPVTNKKVRLDNVSYIFYRNGKEAVLTMWAPQGADNVDQWNRMANSFRWL